MPKVIAQPELSLDDDLKGDPFLKGKMRVEHGLVGLAGLHSLLHGVIALQDDALGAVLAVGGLVPTFDDGEGVHDVCHVVAGDAVKVEVGGV